MSNNVSHAIIDGANLHAGSVVVSGYKHAATVIMAASLINPDQQCNLLNAPHISDMKYISMILNELGADCCIYNSKISIKTAGLTSHCIPEKYSKHIHGAIYFLPTILGRLHQVELGSCGGCQIGNETLLGCRPIDHMLSVLEQFGAIFEQENGKIIGRCNGFVSCTIDIMDYSEDTEVLTGPLVSGATKTAILAAASVSEGITTIHNYYPKPDVTELLNFLVTAGYHIDRSEKVLKISRGQNIPSSYSYLIMSDISQVMTYITLSVYHALPLTIHNVSIDKVKKGLAPEFSYLQDMGIFVQFNKDSIHVNHQALIKPIDIRVLSIGIYSDHQPFFALMLLKAGGCSSITEFVWKKRFDYAKELCKLGLKLQVDGNCLTIEPSVVTCSAQTLIARDLRAAAVLLIVALAVPSKTKLYGIEHLVRGYDSLVDDLRSLGATITLKAPKFLLDSHVYRIKQYTRDYDDKVIDLKRCELIHPSMNKLLKSVGIPDVSMMNRYPDIESAKLKISTALAVDVKRLLLSAGSDSMAFLLINALTKLNPHVVLQSPNYFGWENYAILNHTEITKVPYHACLTHSLPDTPALVIISNPNNPTGYTMSESDLVLLAKQCEIRGHMVVIDECFAGFANIDHHQLLGNYENVIILRSYSKCFGLAGARISLTIASERIVDYLSRWRPDSTVSYPALWFLCRLLDMQMELKIIRDEIIRSKEIFISNMKRIRPNWQALPSAANFVTFRLHDENAARVVQSLKQHGILIKDLSDVLGSNYIRIGIADEKIMRYVSTSLNEINEVVV